MGRHICPCRWWVSRSLESLLRLLCCPWPVASRPSEGRGPCWFCCLSLGCWSHGGSPCICLNTELPWRRQPALPWGSPWRGRCPPASPTTWKCVTARPCANRVHFQSCSTSRESINSYPVSKMWGIQPASRWLLADLLATRGICGPGTQPSWMHPCPSSLLGLGNVWLCTLSLISFHFYLTHSTPLLRKQFLYPRDYDRFKVLLHFHEFLFCLWGFVLHILGHFVIWLLTNIVKILLKSTTLKHVRFYIIVRCLARHFCHSCIVCEAHYIRFNAQRTVLMQCALPRVDGETSLWVRLKMLNLFSFLSSIFFLSYLLQTPCSLLQKRAK